MPALLDRRSEPRSGLRLPAHLVRGTMDGELLKQISIPVFTGVIGYVINWTGVWMLFHPIRFV